MTATDGHVGVKDGRPLAGVRVLEFGHFVAGPFAGTLLSDLGADVVKIEPLSGDALRGENAAPFMSANRGKRAIALDIKADGGAGIVEAATQWADVVTHNFRPGVDKRLGIDAATLRARKPGIVVVQSTAYGPDGPKAALPGFDTLLQGFAGHFVQAGGDETRPLAYRFSHVDYASGMLGALGVVSALYAGRRGGTAPSVNVSLMNTAVFMLSQLVREADGQFRGLPALSADRTGFSPAESLYRAADGWLAVAALGEPAGRRLAEALDLPRVAGLPASQWGEREQQEIGEAISRQTVQAAVGSLRQSGVWAEPVQTEPVPALMSDEGMVAAGTAFVAGSADGAVQRSQPGRIASFRRLSSQLTAADAHVPELGEHTREFLAELGYGPADIDDLLARGVVR